MSETGWEHIRCNLCGADDTILAARKFGMTVVRCRRCSLVYTNLRPSVAEIWSRYSREYFEQEYLPANNVRDGQIDADHLYQHYLPLLGSMRRYRQTNWLLDVGAGAGLFLHAARQDGWQVQGVEIADAGIEFARSRLGLDVLKGQLTELDLPAERYDVVLMQETIEHLLDPMSVLVKIRYLLRLGGVIILTTPNYASLARRLIGSEWSVLSPGEHLFYFEAHTLRAALEKAGFAQIRIASCGSLNPNQVHQRTLRVRLAQRMLRSMIRFEQQITDRGLGDSLSAEATRPF